MLDSEGWQRHQKPPQNFSKTALLEHYLITFEFTLIPGIPLAL